MFEILWQCMPRKKESKAVFLQKCFPQDDQLQKLVQDVTAETYAQVGS